jgi:hypothetical protein
MMQCADCRKQENYNQAWRDGWKACRIDCKDVRLCPTCYDLYLERLNEKVMGVRPRKERIIYR